MREVVRRGWMLAVAALLAGCASIPASGPVRQAGANAGEPQDTKVRVLPPRPRPGASPSDVVSGFLAAAASFEGNHAIARDYLASSARSAWRPSTGVIVVYSGQVSLRTSAASNVVDLTFRQTAEVQPGGHYIELPGPQNQNDPFQLRREAGEWRIEDPPDGLYIAEADLRRAFQLRDVFFLDRRQDVVVPEVLLLPELPTDADALVRRLLLGPSRNLTEALHSAIPPGTRLRTDVRVDGEGVATVDLTAAARDGTDAETRQAMSAQLVWTLRQVPEVRGLRLLVDGEPLPVESANEVQRVREDWPQFDPAIIPTDAVAWAVRAGRLVRVTGGPAPAVDPGPDGISKPAISVDTGSVAWLTRTGLVTAPVDGTRPAQLRLPRKALFRPSWDRRRVVWTYDPAGAGTLWAVPDGRRGPIAVALRDVLLQEYRLDAPVTSLRVSRDGVRVAIVTRDRLGPTRLFVGLIAGDFTGPTPPRVDGLREIFPGVSDVHDVSWVDHHRLALLPRSQQNRPVISDIIGFATTELPRLPAAGESITAAPGGNQPVLVGTRTDPIVLRLDTRGWPQLLAAAREPVYPG